MQPKLLPQRLQNSVRITWFLTYWCNYTCDYCGIDVFLQRSKSGVKQNHAFDHYPVERWLEEFQRLPQDEIYLKITGGEPFLDRANFRVLLLGLTSSNRFQIRIDTNGFWDPAFFADVPKQNLMLVVSYHPLEIAFDKYLSRLREIRDSGFRIELVNFVLAPENLEACEAAVRGLEAEGFLVSVGTMIPVGVYGSRDHRTEREVEILAKYTPPLDLHYRLMNPATKGRLCFHPALSYNMLYDGSISTYCLNDWQNIFTDGPPVRPVEAIPCPQERCDGCMEMYRALDAEPLNDTPLGLYPVSQHAEDLRKHRASPTASVPYHFNPPPKPAPMISADAIKSAVPLEAVFGSLESYLGDPTIHVRSRDRLRLEGWAAGRENVKEIQLFLNDRNVGVVSEFHQRDDVAIRFGRPEFARSGWRTMIYLPSLPHGLYEFRGVGVNPSGESAAIWNRPLRVVND